MFVLSSKVSRIIGVDPLGVDPGGKVEYIAEKYTFSSVIKS